MSVMLGCNVKYTRMQTQAHLIKLHETFPQTIHFISVNCPPVSATSQIRSSACSRALEVAERTVGGGHDVIEELGGAHRAAATLDIVHGGGIRLGSLVHGGGGRAVREGRRRGGEGIENGKSKERKSR